MIDIKLIDKNHSLFQNEAHYWFLRNIIKTIKAETGQYIDLYSDAHFEGKALETLIKYMKNAKALCASAPDSFEQSVGYTFENGARRNIVEKINKADLESEIDIILDFANEALSTNNALEFLGD